MRALLHIIVLLICVPLTWGFALAYPMVWSQLDINGTPERWFAIGFVGFLPLWFVWLRRAGFFSTFEHELSHLLVGLLFLKKPHSFTVHESGNGAVGLYGGNFLITLAPYFLPTFALLQMPLLLAMKPEYEAAYFCVFGVITSFTLCGNVHEFGYHQTDITSTGKIFSTLFILFGNLVMIGMLASFVAGGFSLTGDYFTLGGINAWNLVAGWL